MVVSFSKISIIDGRCDISLRLLRKFQNDRFSGAANGHQNLNIMKLAHVMYRWKGYLTLIFTKKWVFKMIYLIVELDRYYSG